MVTYSNVGTAPRRRPSNCTLVAVPDSQLDWCMWTQLSHLAAMVADNIALSGVPSAIRVVSWQVLTLLVSDQSVPYRAGSRLARVRNHLLKPYNLPLIAHG